MIDFKTSRLHIFPTSDASALDILNYHLKNQDFLKPFNPTPPEDFYSEAYWQRKIWSSQQEWQEDKSYRFVFRLLGDSQSPIIGTANFTQVFRGPLQSCYMGYGIDEEYQGQGLMTEALEVLTDFMFKEKDLHRLSANYLAGNEKSGRVLEKLGFEKEGLAKKYLHIDGEWRDHILTSKVRA
ncbi:MAG: GNAT family N-acetyltransferase [Halobacteriovoraceae bacterium]|nr:GNAT family N-acetyltransferase [Halobacteriovoraceae bacterium]